MMAALRTLFARPASFNEPFIPRHVHLVGSSPFHTTVEFLQTMSHAFPGRLLYIPDGEVGKRNFFVRWQRDIFAQSPHMLIGYEKIGDYKAHLGSSDIVVDIKMEAPGYDNFAIESYAEFCKQREQGLIEKGVRFQVSLPTPVNVIGLVLFPEYRAVAEPIYEKALLACLRRIQDEIPAVDLAVQWDMAYEIGMLEIPETMNPWFGPDIMQGIVERVKRLADAVDEGVKMGFHLCYGDAGHKHFAEPNDMSVLVEVMNAISAAVKRDIGWFHVPVPKGHTDEAYFVPLKELALKPETIINLGLAHAWDLAGTRERIRVASGFIKDFGVGTECGFGRTEMEELESVLGILAEVTEPQDLRARL